ncbi:MAG TPA: glycyl-radical enzyme activating protein [Bacteroidales bacterium]|nr:glycyl-radical enzyme activating protein [Bacteroidales bacterium]
MKGLIFNVKRYSIHDGPGIRVTFFLKGCPLNCIWCHNPEGISPVPEVVIREDRIGDRIFTREEAVGTYYSIHDILDITDRERIFINQSKGGVTFSGGEPLMQAEFLEEALMSCKEHGYHTAVDTSGYTTVDKLGKIMPFTDLFLFDIKHLDDDIHRHYTGVSNKMILENFRFLLKSGRDIMLRIPVIPGINDDEDHLKRIRELIINTRTGSLKRISLLPYHRTGSSKYKRFGLEYRMGDTLSPSVERMKKIKGLFEETGVKVKTGG